MTGLLRNPYLHVKSQRDEARARITQLEASLRCAELLNENHVELARPAHDRIRKLESQLKTMVSKAAGLQSLRDFIVAAARAPDDVTDERLIITISKLSGMAGRPKEPTP